MSEKPRECPFCGKPAGRPLDPTEACCVNPDCRLFHVRFSLADWSRRTPPPATKALIDEIDRQKRLKEYFPYLIADVQLDKFLAEWPQPEEPAHAPS